MTKLEALINELCPDGVEYIKIGDVVDYEQPTKYIVENTDYSSEFDIPVLTAGQTFILGYTNEKNNVYQATKENPVIIFDDFTGAFKWVDFPFKVKSSAMKMLTVKSKSTFLRYIFHVMGNIGFSSDEHKRLWISVYSEFTIPIPPIEVQREIVRILDNFTELTQELTQELTLRKKQYEYYRDYLLNFGDDVEYKTLGEIFDIRNGYTPSKSKEEYWKNGTVPWFRMDDIRENGRILSSALQKVTREATKNKPFSANSIIISTSATIGEHALITVDFMCNQRFTCLTLKKEYQDRYDMMFIFYYCFILSKYCLENLNQSSFASVDMKKFSKFKFPLINIDKQKHLVSILNRFDTLCNDLTDGLPAEIEARQKQYEYYRGKLLKFRVNNYKQGGIKIVSRYNHRTVFSGR